MADANAEYVRLTGDSDLEEIRGRPVYRLDRSRMTVNRNAEAVRDCLKNGSIRNFDVDYVDAAGRVIPC